MGRIMQVRADYAPSGHVFKCTTCQTNAPTAEAHHRPDSDECAAMVNERFWKNQDH